VAVLTGAQCEESGQEAEPVTQVRNELGDNVEMPRHLVTARVEQGGVIMIVQGTVHITNDVNSHKATAS
jgi:hypothetical protein